MGRCHSEDQLFECAGHINANPGDPAYVDNCAKCFNWHGEVMGSDGATVTMQDMLMCGKCTDGFKLNKDGRCEVSSEWPEEAHYYESCPSEMEAGCKICRTNKDHNKQWCFICREGYYMAHGRCYNEAEMEGCDASSQQIEGCMNCKKITNPDDAAMFEMKCMECDQNLGWY